MQIKSFFHKDSKTFSHIVYEQKDAVIIDPVLDFDLSKTTVAFTALEEIVNFIKETDLTPRLVLDTHLHADHMSGAYFLKKRLNVKSAIGRNFLVSQEYFSRFFEITPGQGAYDLLLEEGAKSFGAIDITTLFTPGHTPSCACYLIKDALFCGDALFNPELGCGRTDFPGGSADDLYQSITQKIFSLPPDTRIFVGHDYPKIGEPHPKTTVAATMAENILISQNTPKDEFINIRISRDQSLSPPQLLNYALQVNICGGQLPDKFLKVPITFPKGHF